uniref:ANK_REP_REGION domain-containing protein n=1 Tax=Caenorhabditis tropicalis TaxID=1561998 RepID=A0A1I7TZ89_9PELO
MDTDDDIDEDNRSSIMMFPNESELGDEREEEEEQIEEEEDDDICLGPSQEGRRTDGRASREDVVVDLEEAEIGELEEPVTQNHAHRLVQNNELAGRRMINFDRNEVYMEAICQIKKWRPTIVRLPSNGSTIHDAIMQLIDDTVKKMLLRIDREIILEELSRNFSLHKVMMAVYTKLDTGKVEKTKIVMNLVLSKIPLEILSVRNHGRLSTLLHVAITTRLGALARRMVRLGSPLHLINQEFLTPVDFCIVNGQLENFELCLQYGGTFHYILQGFLEGTYNDSLRYLLWTNPTEIANEFLRIARSANNKMREECVRIRQELGPLMAELDESVIFMIPNEWTNPDQFHSFQFAMFVIPMAFNHRINRFCGSPNVPRMRTKPALCRTECELVNIQNRRTIFFDCTEALKRHFGNVERSRMSPPIWRSQPSGPTLEGLTSTYYENTVHVPFHKRVCTVTLDFAVDEVYSFVTCQIIRYRKNLNVQQPQQLPCTSNYQPSTSSQQPSTSNHQPRYSYNQQSTSNYQPSASNQQPSTSSQQPSTSNHQPRYSYNQPTTSTMRSGFSTNHNL